MPIFLQKLCWNISSWVLARFAFVSTFRFVLFGSLSSRRDSQQSKFEIWVACVKLNEIARRTVLSHTTCVAERGTCDVQLRMIVRGHWYTYLYTVLEHSVRCAVAAEAYSKCTGCTKRTMHWPMSVGNLLVTSQCRAATCLACVGNCIGECWKFTLRRKNRENWTAFSRVTGRIIVRVFRLRV